MDEPEKIIDFHTHWGYGEWGHKRPWMKESIQSLAEKEDEIDATDVAVTPIGSKNKSAGRFADMGSAILNDIKRYEGPIRFHYFARFDSQDENPNSVEHEFKRGTKGIKLQFTPLVKGKYSKADYEKYILDIIQAANEYGLPVFIHSSTTEPAYHPNSIGELAAKVGKGKIVLGHSGTVELSKVDFANLKQLPNIYFDTSSITLFQKSVLLDETKGERVVFSSDSPYGWPAEQMRDLDRALKQTGLEGVREQVFYKTAKKLLNL